MRILLVDDDSDVLQSLLALIKSLSGHEVRAAMSGKHALEQATAWGDLDLLITDVVMQPMDGFILREEMLQRFPLLHTIFVTGYDLSDYPEQTKFHQVLSKPVTAEILAAAIAREFPTTPVEPPRPQPLPPREMRANAAPVPQVSAGAGAAPRVSPKISAPAPAVVPRAIAAPASGAAIATASATPVSASAREGLAAPSSIAAPKVGAVPSARPVPKAVPAAESKANPATQAAPTFATARPVIAKPSAPGAKPSTVNAASARQIPTATAPGSLAAPRGIAQPRVTAAPPSSPSHATAANGHTALPPTEVEEMDFPPVSSTEETYPSDATVAAAGGASGMGLIGQIIGAYQILSLLGEGRWGSVYAAVQISINRPVGLKVLDFARAHDPAAKARFIADARAKANVQHPSILAVYEAGESHGYIFYAHEYVDGRNMAEIQAAGETLDEPTALKVLRVAADGLAYFSIRHIPHAVPRASSIYLGMDRQPRLSNLATQSSEEPLTPSQEIHLLGGIMQSVLPPLPALSAGLRDLLLRCQTQAHGPEAIRTWGQLLQSIKALEPKVVPHEVAKISAQDRAAINAVEAARRRQKRSLIFSIGGVTVLVLATALSTWFMLRSNERQLDQQIEIPGGEFIFGNGETVSVGDFWIDKYETTYGQYARFVHYLEQHPTTEYDAPNQPPSKGATKHKPRYWSIYYSNAQAGKAVHSVPIDLNCPIMDIDYWDAYAYAKWRGRELPTEQEWEKAARGTTGFIYPWGNEFDPKKVNSNADYDARDPGKKGTVDGFNFWSPVDSVTSDKSPFGVIGMAGNVREWTGTWDAAKRHPIIKGGSFLSTDVRLDQRADTFEPFATSEALGFRTVSHQPPTAR